MGADQQESASSNERSIYSSRLIFEDAKFRDRRCRRGDQVASKPVVVGSCFGSSRVSIDLTKVNATACRVA